MFNLLIPLLSLLQYENVYIDNQVFKMHYKVTTLLLLVLSIFVTSKEHFGEPIRCHLHGKYVSEDFINMYCWIRPSFTVDKLQHGDNKQTIGQGVGHFVKGEDTVTHVRYYQWVGIVLFMQAFMFYVPHFLWTYWEGGRVKMLCSDLGNPIVGPEWNAQRQRILAEYLAIQNSAMHNLYAVQFALCEALNLINVMGQIFFLNTFLQGEFIGYGVALAKYSVANNTNGTDPMVKLFPTVTKCEYQNFGPSGGIQKLDVHCVLPLNSLNGKMFAIIWFWLIILTILSAMAAAYRALLIVSPYLRSVLIMASTHQLSRSQARRLNMSLSFGSWFMLNQLSKNINPAIFRQLLSELYLNYCSTSRKFKTKHSVP